MMKKIFLTILLFSTFAIFSQDAEMENALALLSQKKYAEAIAAFKTLAENADSDPAVAGYLGCAHFEAGNFADARECFLKMSETKFADKAAWFFNAANAALAMKDFDDAEALFSKAVEADSEYAAAFLNRGNLRARTGRFDDAHDDYAAYLALRPQDSQRAKIEAIIAAIENLEKTEGGEEQAISNE